MSLPRGERTAITRRAALAAFCMLIATQLLDSWVRQPPLTIWIFRVLPLLIFVPGLIHDRLRTYIWLCFVILLYFLTLVLRLFNDPADPVGWVGMCSVVILFTAAMLYVRWRARELRAGQVPADAAGQTAEESNGGKT